MAQNYGKNVYCFGSIKESFNLSSYANINSLRQRVKEMMLSFRNIERIRKFVS